MSLWTTYRRSGDDPAERGDWGLATDEERQRLLRDARHDLRLELPDPDARMVRTTLPFCVEGTLYELGGDSPASPPRYFVRTLGWLHPLDGSQRTLYRFADEAPAYVDRDAVVEYLRFYFAHCREPNDHRRQLVDDVGLIRFRRPPSEFDRERIRQVLRTPSIDGDEFRGYSVECMLLYGDTLSLCRLHVSLVGRVEIREEHPLLTKLPVVKDALDDFPSEAAGFDLETGWEAASEAQVRTLRNKQMLESRPALVDLDACQEIHCRALSFLCHTLPFFPSAQLIRCLPDPAEEHFGYYALMAARGLYWLNGESAPIHEALQRERFELDADTVVDYLRFFCTFVHGDQGPFHIISLPSDVNARRGPEGRPPADSERSPSYDEVTVAGLRSLIVPPEIILAQNGQWHIKATVQFGEQLFQAVFSINEQGLVEMLDDTALVEDVPIEEWRNSVQTYMPDESSIPQLQTASPRTHRHGRASREQDGAADAKRLELYVHKLLLERKLLRALRLGSAAPLFSPNDEEDDQALLQRFARFMMNDNPVVIVLSDLPFCEELLATLISEHTTKAVMRRRPEPVYSNDNAIYVPELEDDELLLVSLHASGPLLRTEHLASRLGATHAAAIVGADNLHAVPEPLRRVADLVIELPTLDTVLFAEVWHALFRCEPPDEASLECSPWLRYLVPSDLFSVLRTHRKANGTKPDSVDEAQRWSAKLAFQHIHQRIQKRLSILEVTQTPRLADIHGLGEARAIVEDLIADIHAALAGELPWEQVDRGLLMVGEPGTGKTMLARAMARECGVRFINTSGAGTIAGTDGLAEHIVRIRSLFAEARRYAPAILFIDELDAIGSRKRFVGHNQSYNTQIVNTLLQEIQGFDARQPVFVIGATNHIENVDPALQRAGRLDQVVHVPRPTIEALADILRYYLRPLEQQGRVAPDIRHRELAGLALGATGADIERAVRDAARRARKARQPIAHEHLVAAITGQPRDRDRALRLPPDALETTAVHEAGHAVALLLCRHYPARPTYLSIVPRSDGSLGFTASSPLENEPLSRAAYLDYLEVLLAGRAAEELVYGTEGISGGAGGTSAHSDLARATQIALDMVCRFGMGDVSTLRWHADTPSEPQVEEVRRLLSQAYAGALERLSNHRALLDAVSTCLREKLEITAEALERLADRHGVDVPPAAERKPVWAN